MGERYKIIGPLAYRGKQGCVSGVCTQLNRPGADSCYGWHCSYCDAPCSSQGHFACEVGQTLLAEARRESEESGR